MKNISKSHQEVKLRSPIVTVGAFLVLLSTTLTTALLTAQRPSQADVQVTCIVADPTGTPLNIRDKPNGKVVASVNNGEQYTLQGTASDDQGRTWAAIKYGHVYLKGDLYGWVFKKYLICRS